MTIKLNELTKDARELIALALLTLECRCGPEVGCGGPGRFCSRNGAEELAKLFQSPHVAFSVVSVLPDAGDQR